MLASCSSKASMLMVLMTGLLLARQRHQLREISAPPLIRRIADKALEHRGEMRLGLEAHGQGDIHERNFGLLEQLLGTLDATPQQILVRPNTDGRAELCGEMHPAQP